MKHIDKAILLAAAGLTAAALPTFAADPAPVPANSAGATPAWTEHQPLANQRHEWRAAHRRLSMRRLINRLDLSDAQRAQVRHLHAQTMVEVWSARADGNLTVDQLHARIRTAFRAEHDGFRNLLTDQQRAELDQIKGQSGPRP